LKSLAQSGLVLSSGVTVETESGVEALSESFLLAEAQAQAKMVANEEAELKMENKINEAEKNKFLDIVSANEKSIVDKEIEDDNV